MAPAIRAQKDKHRRLFQFFSFFRPLLKGNHFEKKKKKKKKSTDKRTLLRTCWLGRWIRLGFHCFLFDFVLIDLWQRIDWIGSHGAANRCIATLHLIGLETSAVNNCWFPHCNNFMGSISMGFDGGRSHCELDEIREEIKFIVTEE